MAIIAIAGTLSAFGQEGGTQAISGTRQATCVVRVSSDPSVLPLTEELVGSLLASTPVSGEAAREILGARSETLEEDVDISFESLTKPGPAAERNLVGRIYVRLDDVVRPAASEFLAEVCKRLERALGEVGMADEQQLRTRLEQVEDDLRRIAAQTESIRKRQRELLQEAGRNTLSRAEVENKIRELEDIKGSIELDLAGMQASEAALSAQIAKIGQQAIQASKNSEVAAEMAKVVDIREQQVKRMELLVQSGQANQLELGNVQEQLAQARANLAQYREAASQSAGAGLLTELNKNLVELSVESAENEAKLTAVENQLAEIGAKRLMELADRYEREVESQLAMCERVAHDLTSEQYELKDRIRNLRRPEVVVIGGN
jgi:hypothetical protein